MTMKSKYLKPSKNMLCQFSAGLLCFTLLFVNGCGKPVLDGSKGNHVGADEGVPVKADDAIESNNLGPLESDHNINKHDLKFETLKSIKKDASLSIDKLKPVDHMDAVKMEQDGHLNKEYHKELFLGNHEQIELDSKTADAKLKDILRRVDSDNNGHMSEAEMEAWILLKMEEHFDEAVRENEEIFLHLDTDNNGLIHWKDYYTHFLLAKGYSEEKAKKQVLDYDVINLDPTAKEELVRYKFRWTDSDLDPPDNQLNRTEFLSFRHPEQSEKTLSSMVNGILDVMDTNADRMLSLEEFIALPPGEVEGEQFREMDNHWQNDRRIEFKESIDKDHNGKVSLQELKVYMDPRSPIQALMEARNLIDLMDDDKDKSVSMDEVFRHREIFLASKVVDFAANVHDEF